MWVLGALCLLLVSVGASPNSEFVEELVRNTLFPNVTSDLLEDAILDVDQLVRKYRYPIEVHHILTADGYILRLHRIPHGLNRNTQSGNKPVAFVMHGLLGSSADWVITGPTAALAYILAEEGFDVWLGNNRGNYYSRRHVFLNPDAVDNTNFWKFSLDEMGGIDLSSSIDYILERTGRTKLHYIGFSQGTTIFFVLGSLRPEYNDKIASSHMMAPVVFTTQSRNVLVEVLAPVVADILSWATDNGFGEMFPKSLLIANLAHQYCRNGVPTQIFCSLLIFMLGGWSGDQHNPSLIPVKLAHTPAGGSLRQFAHLTQNMASKSFRRYDYGILQNMLHYGYSSPPDLDLKNIKIPVFLHYSEGDSRTNCVDIQVLYDALDTQKQKILLPEKTFSHMDFMWGMNAKTVVYDRIISEMWKIEYSNV